MFDRIKQVWDHIGVKDMRAIWGHVKAVVNQPNAPQSLRLKTTTSGGSRLTECAVGSDTIITRGFQHLALADINVGEVAVVTLRNGSDRLEAERIDLIVFA